MDSRRRTFIRSKAEQIEKESEKYQLIHATHACQKIIRDSVSTYFSEEYDKLLEKMEERVEKGLKIDSFEDEIRKLDSLRRKQSFHVDVTYIDMKNEDSARVVKIENAFVIYLPRSLGEKIVRDDGSFDYDSIKKVRRLMSHELGHMILHTKELLMVDGTQGSVEIRNDDQEAEADYFGRELVELRKDRNKRISDDGGAYKLF